MTEQTPWLLIDVGNTAIKWRLANAEGPVPSPHLHILRHGVLALLW